MDTSSKPSRPSAYSQAHILIEIEDLVSRVVDGPWCRPLDGGESKPYPGVFNETEMLMQMQSLPRYLTTFLPKHDYCWQVDVFWEACRKIGVLPVNGATIRSPLGVPSDLTPEVKVGFEALVQSIFDLAKEDRFRRRQRDFQYEMGKKHQRLASFVVRVLSGACRVLVVRPDLGYRTAYMGGVTVDSFYKDIRKLLSEFRTNKLFDHCIGWAMCLEQGKDRGFHIHLTVFFHGSRRRKDVYIATLIGQLWEALTEGKGTYHNVNARSEDYRRRGTLGIGMIDPEDETARKNCTNAVCYLADPDKDGQQLRIRPAGRRTLLKGGYRSDRRSRLKAGHC